MGGNAAIESEIPQRKINTRQRAPSESSEVFLMKHQFKGEKEHEEKGMGCHGPRGEGLGAEAQS